MLPVLLLDYERIVSPWLRLAQLAVPYRWRIGLAFSLAVAACLLGLAAPLLIERLLIVAGAGGDWSPLAIPAVGLLFAVALQNIASSSNAWLFGGVALDVVRELRRKLYTRL